jgi:hypothetical protein
MSRVPVPGTRTGPERSESGVLTGIQTFLGHGEVAR